MLLANLGILLTYSLTLTSSLQLPQPSPPSAPTSAIVSAATRVVREGMSHCHILLYAPQGIEYPTSQINSNRTLYMGLLDFSV